MSAFTYRSDREADFKCLEDWLAAGMFGPLNEAISYEGTRDPDVLERLHKYVARKGNLVDIGGWKEIYQTTLPTRVDSPLQYTILSGLISRITKVCERIGIDVKNQLSWVSDEDRRTIEAYLRDSFWRL